MRAKQANFENGSTHTLIVFSLESENVDVDVDVDDGCCSLLF
jgi:hypothetical protein